MKTYKKLDYAFYLLIFLYIFNSVSQIFLDLPENMSKQALQNLLSSTSFTVALISGSLLALLVLVLTVIMVYHAYRLSDYVSLVILPLVVVLDFLISVASFFPLAAIALYYIRLRVKLKNKDDESESSYDRKKKRTKKNQR
ncbi:MAG: hypothetical protein ABEI74_00450 [Candidatus Pacearchaeota archaeon]